MNIETVADTISVTNLILAERAARDRSDWNAMSAAYDSDSRVSLSWFEGTGHEFVEQSRSMHERHGWGAHHRLAPALITLQSDRAVAEMGVAIEMRHVLHNVEVDVIAYGRLIYYARRTPAGWALTYLTMIYERDTLTPVLPSAPIPLDLTELAHYRPSYRYLCYLAGQIGGQPRPDLPGDDRPDLVAATYQSAREWLAR